MEFKTQPPTPEYTLPLTLNLLNKVSLRDGYNYPTTRPYSIPKKITATLDI
jgi:hypothetical protein